MVRRRRWDVRGRAFGWMTMVACVAMVPAASGADLSAIEEQAIAGTYGSGVHSYFAGDYGRSYEILSQAIEAGTSDPRAWYFRGLAALKLGRLDEAEADFSAGARRESENLGAWGVAKSLERVQGCDRLQLERHRVRARVASLQEDRRRSRLRYLEVETAEPEVLRDRVPETVMPVAPGGPFKRVEPGSTPTSVPEELAPPVEQQVPEGESSPVPTENAEETAPASSDPFGSLEATGGQDGGLTAP